MNIEPDHLRLIEAALFASAEPLSEAALARFLPEGVALPPILDALRQDYAARGVNLVQREAGWAFRTAPDLAAPLAAFGQATRKLSRAALETLAIIAYHQPATRAEIEAIRGVKLGKGTLDTLFEAGWVRPRGRKAVPGKPVLWVTTPSFLDHFGLASLGDLPGLEELKASGILDAAPRTIVYATHVAPDGADEGEALPEGDLFGFAANGAAELETE